MATSRREERVAKSWLDEQEQNDKGSIILTTNLNFERWEEVFKDPMLTGAIVDRLAHRAHIMDMSREKSYRMEDTIEWSKNIWKYM